MAQIHPPWVKRRQRVGPFLLGRLLGQGAFGAVRVGTHQATHESFAIKILSKTLIREENITVQIQREILIMREVLSPYTIHLFDLYQSYSHIYLVIELLEGGELCWLLGMSTLHPTYPFSSRPHSPSPGSGMSS